MKKYLLVIAIIGSFISCKKDNDPEPASNDFKIGTEWVYKYTDYDQSGSVVSTTNVSLKITGQQTLLGKDWWVASGPNGPVYMRKETDGYYTIRNNVSQLDFKVPAAINDTWRKTYSSDPGDYGDLKVLALNQDVTVPMGTISCYYAEETDSNSLEDKVWYNDANMVVKQIEYDQDGTGALYVDFTLELVSFTP